MTQTKIDADEAIQNGIGLIGDKWSLLILASLRSGEPVRWGAITEYTGCYPATLSNRLKFLEEIGLIERLPHRTLPPSVDYQLTDLGTRALPVVDALGAFATEVEG